mmetsp:Transcript_14352/g.20319  ORF Transcript_14352/g.20319 Transcript_14352/m.20319 type:complete len:89 (+) Transcript_14352:238-504(+)
MPPNAKEADGQDVASDLQKRIDLIASAAKTRNPTGFRLAPVSPTLSAHSSSSESENNNFINTASGQMVVMLDSARNVHLSHELQAVNF